MSSLIGTAVFIQMATCEETLSFLLRVQVLSGSRSGFKVRTACVAAERPVQSLSLHRETGRAPGNRGAQLLHRTGSNRVWDTQPKL